MYCKCTIFINLVLYGYWCGFKAKFVAKRNSGLKTDHYGILGVKNKPGLPKNPQEILGNTIDSWERRKSDNVRYEMRDAFGKLREIKAMKRANFRSIFIRHILTYLPTVLSIH